MKAKDFILVLLSFATFVTGCMAQQTGCKASRTNRHLLGAVTGKSAIGQQWSINDHPASVYLISFVQTVPDTAAIDSRTQSLSLSSMAHQYRGALAVLVDASVLKTNRIPEDGELLNAWHDWSLRDVVLLSDARGNIRQAFGVCDAPETFLLDSDGTVLEHWNSLVPTGMLALAVERALPDEAAALHASRVKKKPISLRD